MRSMPRSACKIYGCRTGPMGWMPLTAAALVLTAQLTGEPWKPCAFNDTPIDWRRPRNETAADQTSVDGSHGGGVR
jgi:hypothetical protein